MESGGKFVAGLLRQIRKETGKRNNVKVVETQKKVGSREELNAINHRAMSGKQMDDDEATKRKKEKKKKKKERSSAILQKPEQPAPVLKSFGGIYGPP